MEIALPALAYRDLLWGAGEPTDGRPDTKDHAGGEASVSQVPEVDWRDEASSGAGAFGGALSVTPGGIGPLLTLKSTCSGESARDAGLARLLSAAGSAILSPRPNETVLKDQE